MWEGGALIVGALIGALGGYLSSQQSSNMGSHHDIAKNRDMQLDFAKKGIYWRVQDAKRAGIHPLAALGAQTTSFSPVQIGGGSDGGTGAGAGAAMQSFGQNLTRAAAAMQTEQQKEAARIDLDLKRAQLDEQRLINHGLRKEIDERDNQIAFPSPNPDGKTPVGRLGVVSQDSAVVKAGVNPITGNPPGVQYQDVPVPKSQQVGVRAGTEPMTVTRMRGPYAYNTLNDQAGDALESDKVNEVRFGLDQTIDLAKGWAAYLRPDRQWSKNFIAYLRKYFRPQEPPEVGKHWAFNALRGQFHQVPGPAKCFFDDCRGNIPW